jgi:hypothetical protein
MRSRRSVLQAVVLLTTALALPALAGSALNLELEPGLSLLPALTVDSLALFPVVREKAAPKGTYLTLSEGLKEKLVKVSELKGGSEVNQVQVKNASDKSLLLLGGELILGGQQDRVISTDTILEPRTSRAVAVFCVEHGRWQGQGAFTHTGGFAEGKLRRVAKFDKEQGQVWNQVATKTGALKAGSATGTYRTLATGAEGKKAIERFAPLKQSLLELPEAGELVGVVAAVNGVVRSVDIFSSAELFAAYRDGLLEAAFVDAADTTAVAGKAPPRASEVKDFIQANEQAKPEDLARTPTSHTVQKKTADSVNSTLSTPASAEPIYRSYQNSKY